MKRDADDALCRELLMASAERERRRAVVSENPEDVGRRAAAELFNKYVETSKPIINRQTAE